MRPLFASLLLAALAQVIGPLPDSTGKAGFLGRINDRTGPASTPAPRAFGDLPANTANPPFTGIRRTTWKVTEPGVYVFPAGTTVAIPASQARTQNAVEIKASGVTIRGLKVTSGFRGFSCQSRSNITLDRCTITGCGIKPSGGSHGGSNILFVDCKRVTFSNCSSTEPLGEHCLYIAQSADAYTVTGCTFGRSKPPGAQYQGVCQINSQNGTQATNIQFSDCKFSAKSPEDVVAVMGGGTQTAPVKFSGGSVTGGRRFLATNYGTKRPSYVLLQSVPLVGVRLVTEGGSWIRKQ